MTAKQFFKSTTFKCIVTLLSILLVCGVFLTIMYGFLEVTEGERLQRAISNMYDGKEVTVYGLDDQIIDASVSSPQSLVTETKSVGRADVTAAYRLEFTDGDVKHTQYLVLAKGKDGEGGGSVTCWVAVEIKDNKISEIYNVSINTNDGQEYIGRFSSSYFDIFKGEYNDEVFSTGDGYLVSGATLSSNAINNAVNGAINYVKTEFLGEVLVEVPYSTYIDLKKVEFNKSERKFTIVTSNGGFNPDPFTVEIVVTADKKIESFKIAPDGNGSTEGYDADMKAEVLDGSLFAGKTLAEIEALIANGEYAEGMNGLNTGATQSNFICGYTCAFALANYDSYAGGNQ